MADPIHFIPAMKKSSLFLLVASACSLFGHAAHAADPTPSSAAKSAAYTVSDKWSLGDAAKWDYLAIDEVHHRLFLSHTNKVLVVDLPSGKLVGEIAGTDGVHGIAFAQDLKLGFTSNGKANSVTVFDLETLNIKQHIKITGLNPDAIMYDEASHNVITFNGKSSDLTVIDANSLQTTATIKVDGKPEFAANNLAGKIFFNVEDKAEIQVLDIASKKITATWPLAGCEEPSGLALDHQHNRLFSVCQNKTMVVTDAKTGQHIAAAAIGLHPDATIYDSASGTIFSSNSDGTLSVIHQDDADHYSAAASIITAKGAKTMAMDFAAHTLYLPAILDKKFTVLVVRPAAF